jgi:hypothetical protein
VDHLLLQRPVETLGYTIGLWLGDKGEARRNTPELDRVEEIIGGVLCAVVHAQNQPASGIGACGAPEDRLLVLLRLLVGLEFQEIAEVMNLGLSATKMRYTRAIATDGRFPATTSLDAPAHA